MRSLALLVAVIHSTAPFGETPPAHSIPVVTVVGGDYYFQAPRTLTAGWMTLRFLNRGKEVHMLGVTRLDSAHTMGELLTLLAKGVSPAWAVDVGGANVVSPGEASNTTLRLDVGHYMFVCWIVDAQGRFHAIKGMASPLEVTAAKVVADSTPLPRPDIIATLADYHITLSSQFTRGHHVIEVENKGPHEHDFTVLRVKPGVSDSQALAWFDSPAHAPAAATALGGVVGFWPGGKHFFTADVGPGRYLLLCFVPDDSGRPHYRHGMVNSVTVR